MPNTLVVNQGHAGDSGVLREVRRNVFLAASFEAKQDIVAQLDRVVEGVDRLAGQQLRFQSDSSVFIGAGLSLSARAFRYLDEQDNERSIVLPDIDDGTDSATALELHQLAFQNVIDADLQLRYGFRSRWGTVTAGAVIDTSTGPLVIQPVGQNADKEEEVDVTTGVADASLGLAWGNRFGGPASVALGARLLYIQSGMLSLDFASSLADELEGDAAGALLASASGAGTNPIGRVLAPGSGSGVDALALLGRAPLLTISSGFRAF